MDNKILTLSVVLPRLFNFVGELTLSTKTT